MIPEISVIIPVYNREKSIKIALDSLKSQIFKRFEVIVVNDGSNDQTLNTVMSYCENDSRIKIISQINSGVSSARNSGLALSKGKYITFLDSDDYYNNNFLNDMYNKIISSNADVCYCGYNVVSSNSIQVQKMKFTSENVLENYLLNKLKVHTTGWMIKREFLESNNITFSTGYSWGEDVEFFSKVLAVSKNVVFIESYLTNYTKEKNDNLSQFSIDKIDKDYEMIYKMLMDMKFEGNLKVQQILHKYRLPALIVYRLNSAFTYNVQHDVILDYFHKYKKEIVAFNFYNGTRSLKLNLIRAALILKIIRIKAK